jgi:hypothetical protein
MDPARVLAVIVSILVGSATLWAGSEGREPTVRLEVLLTTTPTLPDGARASMMNEASAIWRDHGVAIDWLPPTVVRPVSQYRLRVLVVERRSSTAVPSESLTIGQLVRPGSGHPVAMVSIESARRLVASVRGRAGYELVTVDQSRLGLVLGRALAHEIGHYLLDTQTHAHYGLMRPQFNALEFTDLRDGTFALDRAASEWLKSPFERFAYTR